MNKNIKIVVRKATVSVITDIYVGDMSVVKRIKICTQLQNDKSHFKEHFIYFLKPARSEKSMKTLRREKQKIMDFKKQMHQYNTPQTTKLYTCGKLFKNTTKKREKHNHYASLSSYLSITSSSLLSSSLLMNT